MQFWLFKWQFPPRQWSDLQSIMGYSELIPCSSTQPAGRALLCNDFICFYKMMRWLGLLFDFCSSIVWLIWEVRPLSLCCSMNRCFLSLNIMYSVGAALNMEVYVIWWAENEWMWHCYFMVATVQLENMIWIWLCCVIVKHLR